MTWVNLADPNQYSEHFDTVTTSATTGYDEIDEIALQPGDIIAINYGNGSGHNLIVGDDGKIYGASTYGIACYDSLQDLYDHYALQYRDWAIRRLKDEYAIKEEPKRRAQGEGGSAYVAV